MRFALKLAAIFILPALIWSSPARAADHGKIYFSAGANGLLNIWRINPDGKGLKQITSGSGTQRFPTISPDGKSLICVNENRMPVLIDIASAARFPIPIPEGIYAQPAWFPGGDGFFYVRYLVLPADQSEIWGIKKNNGGWDSPQRITNFPPMFLFPAPCPKGPLMACTQFHRDKNRRAVEEIFLMKLDGSDRRAITEFGADSYGPAWSPEGKRILFTSNCRGDYNVWLYDLKDGSTRMLTTHEGFDGEPSWAPDGRSFVFVSSRSGARQLWLKEMVEGPARRLTHMEGNVMNPVWSRLVGLRSADPTYKKQ